MAKKTPTPQLSEELWQSKWQDRLAQCAVDKVTLRELQDQPWIQHFARGTSSEWHYCMICSKPAEEGHLRSDAHMYYHFWPTKSSEWKTYTGLRTPQSKASAELQRAAESQGAASKAAGSGAQQHVDQQLQQQQFQQQQQELLHQQQQQLQMAHQHVLDSQEQAKQHQLAAATLAAELAQQQQQQLAQQQQQQLAEAAVAAAAKEMGAAAATAAVAQQQQQLAEAAAAAAKEMGAAAAAAAVAQQQQQQQQAAAASAMGVSSAAARDWAPFEPLDEEPGGLPWRSDSPLNITRRIWWLEHYLLGRNPQEMRQYLNEELTRAATRDAAPEGQQREAAPVATVIVPDAEPAEKRVKEEESATERIVVDDEYGEVEAVEDAFVRNTPSKTSLFASLPDSTQENLLILAAGGLTSPATQDAVEDEIVRTTLAAAGLTSPATQDASAVSSTAGPSRTVSPSAAGSATDALGGPKQPDTAPWTAKASVTPPWRAKASDMFQALGRPQPPRPPPPPKSRGPFPRLLKLEPSP